MASNAPGFVSITPPTMWPPWKKRLGGVLVVGILVPWTWAMLHYSDPEAQSRRAVARKLNYAHKSELLAQFNTLGLDHGLREAWRDVFVAGGPHKDAVDPLVDPPTELAAGQDFFPAQAPVVSVEIAGQARAYPLWTLAFRQIINDTLAGTPIAVIYCPLSDAVTVVDRRIEDQHQQPFEFAFSGLLINSNFVFYDRQDRALWSQLGFQAISGPHVGQSLPHRPFAVSTLDAFMATHPGGDIVAARDSLTGVDPYECYKCDPHIWYPLSQRDPRLGIRDRVLGVQWGGRTWALPLELVQVSPGRQVRMQLGDAPPLVIAAGPNPGELSILAAPADARLATSFWFMWSAMHPDTSLASAADLTAAEDQ